MQINFFSCRNSNETHTLHERVITEMMDGSETNEIMEDLFDSLL